MSIPREECLVIGGMGSDRGRAGFDRVPLVLECQGKRYIVRRIAEAGLVTGEPVSDEEWRGVLASEEALELSTPQEAAPNAYMWLLRRNFSFRDRALDTLEERGAVLHQENAGGVQVLLVDESKASGLTDEWAGQAWNEAWAHARTERLSQAVESAELSMSLARGLQVDHMAFLSLLYELQGDKERAEAILELARNSRGDAFYERACEKKERFVRDLLALNASAPRCRRFARKVFRRRETALRAAFDPLLLAWTAA